jgi:iron complex outermembrane receptor protein
MKTATFYRTATSARRLLPGAAFAFLIFLSGAGAAFCEETDIFDFFRQELVYSAARHEQKLSEAPATAYVLTADEIERYGYRTIGEALQGVPGFYVTNDRNYTYLWVRGFGRPSDYNSRVLLMVNGHRLNENVYGSVFLGQESGIDIRCVKRLEIVKGPGSALYGDNAFLATVNIVTKKAGDGVSATLNAEAGSYGTSKGFADLALGGEKGDGVYAAAASRYMRGQDLYYGDFSGTNGGKAQGMDHEKSDTAYLNFNRAGWALQGGASKRAKSIPTGAYGTLFNNKVDETKDWRSFLDAEKSFRLGSGTDLTARLFYDRYSYEGDYLYPSMVLNKDFGETVSYGGETRARFSFLGEGNELLLGQEYENSSRRLQKNYDADPYTLFLDKNVPTYRWAVYAQQEAAPIGDLKFTLGLRYDRYKTFGHSLNPRLAAVYNLEEKDTVKLLYGSAFRAPNTFEMDYDVGSQAAGNPDLQPETIRTYEAVYERTLPSRGFVSLAIFQNDIKNLISQITNSGGLLQFVNKGHVTTRGIEASSKFALTDRLSGHLGYTLQDTRETGHSRLTNSPANVVSAGLSQWLPRWRTSVSAEAFYLGERRTYRDTVLSGAAQVSLNVRTRPWEEGPSVYAGVYNLANAPYFVSGAGEHTQAAIRQDGRNYILGLDWRF